MVQTIIDLEPIDPKVIGEYGTTKIYGKRERECSWKCLDILAPLHIRYSDVPKVLELLFILSKNKLPGTAFSGAKRC